MQAVKVRLLYFVYMSTRRDVTPGSSSNSNTRTTGNDGSAGSYDGEVASAQKFLDSGVGDDFLTRLLFPGLVADEDYARQIELMDLQNQYNSPAAQMARYKEAGINVNAAAAGIAGGGNATASAPSVNSGQAASAESAQGLASLAQGTAGVTNAAVGAFDTLGTLALRKDKLSKEIGSLVKGMGFTDAQTRSLEISLKYMDEKEALGVATMMANLDNIYQQYDFYNQQMAESKKRIQQMDADIALANAQKDYTTALKLQAEKNTSILELQRLDLEWYKNMRESYNMDFHSAPFQMILQARLQGNTGVADVLSNGIYEYNYRLNEGVIKAEVDNAFNLAWNSTLGSEQVKSSYAPYYTSLENFKSEFQHLLEVCMPTNVNDFQGALVRFMGSMQAFLNGLPYPDAEHPIRTEMFELPTLQPK